MPTPMHVWAEIAGRFGVDPSDEDAVDWFYTETVSSLPKETQEAILAELLCRDGENPFVNQAIE